MKLIYIIQHRHGGQDEFALTYEAAKSELERRGYVEIQPLNEEENEAGIFERPEELFFEKAEARVISRKLIG